LSNYPAAVKWFIIGGFVFLILLFYGIGAALGIFGAISIGRDGLHFNVRKKETQRQFESGSINKMLDDQIARYDKELEDFALDQSNKLRRTLNIKLREINCSSTRRSLASCLRYPLWEASRRNNFKDVLRPEKAKEYITKLMKELKEEYQAFAIEKEVSYCSVDEKMKCADLPSLDELLNMLENEIIIEWVLAVREKTMQACEKKIKCFQDQIPLYEQLKDGVRIKITQFCIGKNEGYIKALSRPPQPGEI